MSNKTKFEDRAIDVCSEHLALIFEKLQPENMAQTAYILGTIQMLLPGPLVEFLENSNYPIPSLEKIIQHMMKDGMYLIDCGDSKTNTEEVA